MHENIPAADVAGARRDVLIVSSQVPGYDSGFEKSGHAQYLNGIIDFLKSRGHAVTLLVFRPAVNFVMIPNAVLGIRVIGPAFTTTGRWTIMRDPAAVARFAAWNIYARLPQGIQAFLDTLRKRARKARGKLHNLGVFISAAEIAHASAVAHELKPALIFYDSVFNVCGKIAPVDHWVITHEIKHERVQAFRERGIEVGDALLTRDAEAEVLASAGKLIAIQWDDAETLKQLVPSAEVVVAPVTMTRSSQRPASSIDASACMFVASGSYHNLDGLTWFLEQCWPLILARRPEAALDIYGTICYRLNSVPAGVTLKGVVEDLGTAYDAAALTIVPLQVGSGLKVKIVEALSRAQAVVTTSIGAQGLLAVNPRPFMLADTADEFANAVCALLESPAERTRLQQEAWNFATVFEPDAAFAPLARALAGR